MLVKIRTTPELEDRLIDESGWRRKEIISLRLDIRHGVNIHAGKCRALVCLLYAHWEGFVSVSAGLMLTLIGARRHSERDVNPALRAALWRARIHGLRDERTFVSLAELFMEMERQMPEQAKFGKSRIPTEANLSYRVFEGFQLSFGISPDPYLGYRNQIDTLLGDRNQIAHGERLELEFDVVAQRADDVLALMSQWVLDLRNSAQTYAYLSQEEK